MRPGRATIAAGPAAILLLAASIVYALLRPVDGDEGYFLYAARAVMDGKLPYRDFFYPQMPLLPFIYGVWMKLVGFSWTSARGLSALIAAASGMLVYAGVARKTGNRGAAGAAAAVYLASCLGFGFIILAKSYGLTVLFLLLAWHFGNEDRRGGRDALLTGLFLGLATGVRLTALAALPAMAWFVGNKRRALPWFLAGFGLALAPVAPLLLADPGAAWFGNIGYHAIRSDAGLFDPAKLDVALRLLGLSGRHLPVGWQFAALLAAAAAATLQSAREKSIGLAPVMAGLIMLAAFLPTPCYPQYFAVAVPFLILSLAPAAKRLASRGRYAVVILALYLLLAAPAYRNLHSDSAGPGEMRNWRLPQLRALSREIDALVPPGECVPSPWPGYLLATRASACPGLENQFGLQAAELLPDLLKNAYHISGSDGLAGLISSRKSRVVIVDSLFGLRVRMEKTAVSAGYRRAGEIDGVIIYALP